MSRTTGTLAEKLDSPPYSYLRLKTQTGEVWAAVPVARLDEKKGPLQLTVLNGVAVKNVEVRALGRRLDVVIFGTLDSSSGTQRGP